MTCPCCFGEGTYTDTVTDDGRGPSYECGYCGKGEGKINFFLWIAWWLCIEPSFKKYKRYKRLKNKYN
jgi:hypothetical protein